MHVNALPCAQNSAPACALRFPHFLRSPFLPAAQPRLEHYRLLIGEDTFKADVLFSGGSRRFGNRLQVFSRFLLYRTFFKFNMFGNN